jgi:opacity protein-like surface antigen
MIFGDLLEGPIGTSLSNANGSVAGAQLSVPVAGPVSLYVSGGLARSDLNVGLPIFGGIAIGSTDAWLLDGGLEVRVPTAGAISPVLQAGAGVTHYSISNTILETESTSGMGVLGLGVDMAITRNIGLRLMARDHIGKFDFREAVFVDIQGRTAHNVGLTAGLRLAF